MKVKAIQLCTILYMTRSTKILERVTFDSGYIWNYTAPDSIIRYDADLSCNRSTTDK